jgi:nucleotide-binding universal stress UspA family protein
MLKRLLIGLNGSPYSRAATDVTLALARHHGASVTGLGVVDVPHLTGPEAVPLGAGAYKAERDATLVKAANARISGLLVEFERRCAALGIQSSSLKLCGDPEKLLAREAQGADLLVMGKKSIPEDPGNEATQVLRQTLRHATRPVLCVCEEVNNVPHTAHVLVAYDGSPQAAKTLHIFHSLGLTSGREVHLLMVTRNSEDQRTLGLAAGFLKLHGESVHSHIMPSGLPASSVILSEAKRLHAGLIVMGAYGQPLIKETVFGSVTARVLKKSNLPLFLYH